MNPGLVVKLRPTGPWRIGPDSGARNRVDFIYHSDTLYSAVASAMARLGSLDAWLDATARRAEGAPPPAVCFSSCFPFLDEIGFVVPPRTVWPPVSRALVSARVRWKSARFVPLGVVQAILSGQRLDDNHWSVDGASECLVPAGRPGPFRTAVRWSAAVDRLTGSTERHSTACMEFRPGAGLWTIVSFADADAHTRWLEPIKAAFRLLADTGFGGERSRGWGRSESPEFIDGILPDMILPPPEPVAEPIEQPAGQPAEEPVGLVPDLPTAETVSPVDVHSLAPELDTTPPPAPPPVGQVLDLPTEEFTPSADGQPPAAEHPVGQVVTDLPIEETVAPVDVQSPAPELDTTPPPAPPPVGQVTDLPTEASKPSVAQEPPELPTPATEPPAAPAPVTEPPSEQPPIEEPTEATAAVRAPSDLEPLIEPLPPTEPEPAASTPVLVQEAAPSTTEPTPPLSESEPGTPEAVPVDAAQETEPIAAHAPGTPEPEPPAEPIATPAPGPRPPAPENTHPHWMLSLFTPAPADAVDWHKGNYTVLARGGRVDSPAGSGELKKQIQMVAEGSVVYAPTGPWGTAADVAPDGFAHPVFRAGFAVSIPLPEVS